ncbi:MULTISPECIES: hypothetical protein [unclassified Roseovarius]|uniref:hypothetical protein n=1 Tax=unclassified Roseovarius TaxID=2614913 RepID=UPI00273F54AF|nr:hypothetical protein [Roseovarius sp. MMSF_3350]
MKRLALATLLSLSPIAATATPLAEDLKNYIVAFDMAALDTEARTELRTILDDPDRSHGNKVLSVHSVLDRHGALREVDIHGGPLDAPETQVGLASYN